MSGYTLLIDALSEILESIAADLAQAGAKGLRRAARVRGGRTLRPGASTPMWNELSARARAHLSKRGSKAHLARLLGLPRQRVQDCLKAKTATLDAERTLMLVCWVEQQERTRKTG